MHNGGKFELGRGRRNLYLYIYVYVSLCLPYVQTIMVIAFYSWQVATLKRLLRATQVPIGDTKAGSHLVKAVSVDGSQGDEREVVIVDMVVLAIIAWQLVFYSGSFLVVVIPCGYYSFVVIESILAVNPVLSPRILHSDSFYILTL